MLRLRIALLIGTVLVAACLAQGSLASAGAAAGADGPQATAAKTWTFSGRGPKRLGTIRLRHAATLRWRTHGGLLQITDARGFRLLYTKKRRGRLKVRAGKYERLSLSARGSWRITIRERR